MSTTATHRPHDRNRPDGSTRIVVVGGVAGGMSAPPGPDASTSPPRSSCSSAAPTSRSRTAACPTTWAARSRPRTALLVQTPESLRAALDLDVRPRHEVTAVDLERQTVQCRGRDGATSCRTTPSCSPRVPAPCARRSRASTPRACARCAPSRTPSHYAARSTAAHARRRARRRLHRDRGRRGARAAGAWTSRSSSWLRTCCPRSSTSWRTWSPTSCARSASTCAPASRRRRSSTGPSPTSSSWRTARASRQTSSSCPSACAPTLRSFEAAGIECERGAIVVDEHGRTSAPNVWAVGDAVVSHRRGHRGAPPGPARRTRQPRGPARRRRHPAAGHRARDPRPARHRHRAGGGPDRRHDRRQPRRRSRSQAWAYRTLHLHPHQHAGYFPGRARCTSSSTSTRRPACSSVPRQSARRRRQADRRAGHGDPRRHCTWAT